MIPGRLPKHRKANRVHTTNHAICAACRADVREKVRTEQTGLGRPWFKHHGLSDDLAAVGPNHLNGRNRTGLFAYIQIGTTICVKASFRKVYATLRIVRKT